MAFAFKPFERMTAEDYANIGFRCGLEVHRQLLTETKLFCRCPAGRYSGRHDAEILRHMRPTLSELGEYDGTALMEKKTRKNIYYRINRETVCTYEFDDTPPFFINEQALDIALEICLLLRMNIVGELHIARKQYLDGSIPTGFQRTGILAVGGWLPYRQGRIRIRQLSLEEDACREVSDVGHDRVYLTDRLGMPLIEIVTEPDMHTPQQAAEVCQLIRRLCRSTHKVRTGYGAARQDVNVSVRGGTRIEIKGVPQIWRIPRLVYNEARRQCALLHIRAELRRRGLRPESFRYTVQDVTPALSKTSYEPIRAALAAGLRVRCTVLRGFAGLLNHPTQEHTVFAKEFSDRVRVIACLTRLPNLVHSDSASETLSARDWQELRKKTAARPNDALLVVWGEQRDASTACEEIALRARQATEGVPSDTRQALKDGTNGFERVLPGADRMYPDTDLPPLAITEQRIGRLRARLPPLVWEREARYRALGLPPDVVTALCVSQRAGLFDRLVAELRIDPVFAGVVLCQRLKALRRAGLSPERLSDEEIYAVFQAHAAGRLAREGVVAALERLLADARPAEGRLARVPGALAELGTGPLSDGELDEHIALALRAVGEVRFKTPAKEYRFLMGVLMRRLVGRAAGRRVARRLAGALGLERAAAAGQEAVR